MERFIYGKLGNLKKHIAYYIRPIDWAGIWNKDDELISGNYYALFNEENDAKKITEQLNLAVNLKQEKEELINYCKDEIEEGQECINFWKNKQSKNAPIRELISYQQSIIDTYRDILQRLEKGE